MRKTFPLEVPPHKPPRVIEQIKSEVRKYLKRERRKRLPEGADFWDFECRAGRDDGCAGSVHVSALAAAIDKASAEDWGAIYIEILARPGVRKARPRATSEPGTDPG